MRRMISVMSDKELRLALDAIVREQALRRKLDASPEKIDRVTRQYQAASGVKDGEPWKPATSPLMRPMEGARRTHDGKLWRSTIDHNVFEPGVSSWKLEPELDEDGNEIPPPFHRPSGQHDAYEKGQRITWEDGEVYEATRDNVDWDPGNSPDDWRRIVFATPIEPADPIEPDDPGDEDDDGNGDTGNDDDPDAEPEPEPEPAEPGTIDNPYIWDSDAAEYEADEYVIYQGVVYRIVQDHESAAHWKPDQLAALYERQ